ncbi:MAG: hypothetical protein NW217_04375 [Hyphomicrobiaceae bacterium]|nr:hypothetical protein [Hyphomicrobiaceae bacterium]
MVHAGGIGRMLHGQGEPSDSLSEAEALLVAAACRGEAVDLAGGHIRGSVLREVLTATRPEMSGLPTGLRLSKAIVTGGLDLEGCNVAIPVLLWNVRIEKGKRGALILRDARIKRLGIHSCDIAGALIADRAEIDNGMFVGGGVIAGPVQVRGADIGGALAFEGTELGDGKSALLAAGVRLAGPLILRKARLAGFVGLARAQLAAGIYAEEAVLDAADAGLVAESARIDGDVLLDRARITVSAGRAVCFSHARIGGRVSGRGLAVAGKPEALAATGVTLGQGLDLEQAVLQGQLVLAGATIARGVEASGIDIEGSGPAIVADGLSIGGNWSMARARLVGHLSCPGADIRGQLRLTEARVYGADLAIRADGARIRGGCYMSRAVIFGLLRFPAAEIGNQFRLRGATVRVDKGAALLASGTRFSRDVELNGGLETAGAIVLDQARIPGVLDLTGSQIRSAAIARAGTQRSNSGGATTGPSKEAQHPHDELAVSLVDADVNRLHMPAMAEHRPVGVIDLSRARAGTFTDYSASWPPHAAARSRAADGRDIDHLDLDGFTYEHLGNPSGGTLSRAGHANGEDSVAERRLAWLDGQESCDIHAHFKPQPWVELGKRLAAQGYHEDARSIAIARLRLERRSASTRVGQRWQGAFLDLFALYGFNPWRTVVWMAVFIVAFAGVWAWAAGQCSQTGCRDESVFVVTARDSYTPERFEAVYPDFNALAYSFDTFVPFVSFGYADHWRPNVEWQDLVEMRLPFALEEFGDGPSAAGETRAGPRTFRLTTGGILYVLAVVETIIGIVLTSLLITGFTGLLRAD